MYYYHIIVQVGTDQEDREGNGQIEHAHICAFCNFASAMHVHLYSIYCNWF